MTDQDSTAFFDLVDDLCEVYQAKVSTREGVIYWEALKDLPLWQVKAAMFQHFKTSEYFPKPAEIRRLAWSGQVLPDPEPPPPRKSLQAMPVSTNGAAAAKAIVLGLFAGTMDRAQAVEAMRAAEQEWPGIGWAREANHLEAVPPAGLREDFVPPHWRAQGLEIVGKTPMGCNIVRPRTRNVQAERKAMIAQHASAPALDEVPF